MSSGRGSCLLLLQLIQYGILWSVKGEWFIEYQTFCAVIRAIHTESRKTERGGSHIARERGWGKPNHLTEKDSTKNLVLFILYVFFCMVVIEI
jgi:hypothetical protein